MTRMVLTGLIALAVLTVLGLAVLAPLRATRREALLPAAPVLGAALLAVVMSTTSWLLPAPGGLAATAAAAVGLVVLALRRGQRPWRFSRRALVTAGLVLAVGLTGAAVALVPNAWVGDGRAMSPNGSHDIYYYVAESTWLLDHPITPAPELGPVPGDGDAAPADNPMRAALAIPLRIGQPMVQAALMAATGQRPVDAVMVLTALWVLLVAPGAFVAARLVRLRPAPALAVAAVSATSALVVQQVYQQNVDALLGVSLALLTLAGCVAAVERRVPIPMAALWLAGLVAVYTEYSLFVAPAVAVAVLARRRLGRTVLGRAAAILGLAVALAPTAWIRGAGVLGVDRAADAETSPLFSDGWYLAVSRFVGAAPLTGSSPSRAAVVMVAFLTVGWALAVLLHRHRTLWLTVLVVGLGFLASVTIDGRGYTQLRSASLLQPLLLLTSGAGWAALLALLRARRPGAAAPGVHVARARIAAVGPPAALALVAVVVVAVNLRAAPAGLDRPFATSRHVDEAYDEVTTWVQANGGPDGRDVTALVPDLFAQVWAAGALRGEPLVAYPALRPDYLGLTSYWAGEVDRFLLIGPGAHLAAPDEAVVARNSRFRLVDLDAGAVLAATPTGLPDWAPGASADGAMVGPDLGTVLVFRSAAATSTPSLELASAGASGRVAVLVTVIETGATSRATLDADGTPVRIDLGSLRSATVTVDLAADAASSSATFVLIGVTDGT